MFEGIAPQREDHESDDLDITFEALFRPHLTRQQRAWRGAGVAGSILLALAVIVASFPALRAGIGSFLNGTSASADSGEVVFLDTNLPDMVVTLDGQQLPQSDLGARRGLRPASGKHTLIWHAGPFTPQSCTFSVPEKVGDTCTRIFGSGVGTQIEEPSDSIVLLHASLSTLASARRTALISALQQPEGVYGDTVQPGEPFFTDSKGRQIAQQPLRADLRITLDTSDRHADAARSVMPACAFSQQNNATAICPASINLSACADLCILPFGSSTATNMRALAQVRLTWDYTTLDGTPVALDQPDGAGGAALSDHYALFNIQWDGTNWHVSLYPTFDEGRQVYVGNRLLATDLGCIAASDMVLDSSTASFQVGFHAGSDPAEGCVITAPVPDDEGIPANNVLLYRFGVLLTANNASHKALPYLPVARGDSLGLAQQLEQIPGWSTNTLPLGVLTSL